MRNIVSPLEGIRSPFGPRYGGFSPASLFAAGEQGVWYDPSDFSTMFQDAAGTTPVTAVEQPVRLLLDKSKNGVGTNGAKRLNLLTYSEQFDNTAWAKVAAGTGINPVVTANDAVAPDGTTTADKIVFDRGVGNTITDHSYIQQSVTVAVGSTYTAFFWIKAATAGDIGKQLAYRSVAASSYTTVTLTASWQRLTLTEVAVLASPTVEFASRGTVSSSNSVGVLLWGADLRLTSEASTAPTYQPITASWALTIPGNHATQSTSGAQPVLSARVNLLTYSEQFDNAAWTKTSTTVTANAAIAPDGTTTADALIPVTTGFSTYQTFNVAATYAASVSVKDNGAGSCLVAMGSNTIGYLINVNLSTGAYISGRSYGGGTLVSYTIVSEGSGWWRITVIATASVGGVLVGAADGTSPSSGIYIWGADLRPTNQTTLLPAYQRIAAATDYDTTGFPFYLRFDGTDDSMATGTITPGIDKAQVFAGVRKLTDVAYQMLCELGATVASNNGSFAVLATSGAPTGATGKKAFHAGLRGTALASYDMTTYDAPSTNVMYVGYDIGGAAIGAEIVPRVNGATPTLTAVDAGPAGTGNYGSYPLFIGRRNNATLPFNGNLYSLIVRFGSNLDATTISNTETWVNGKTLAY